MPVVGELTINLVAKTATFTPALKKASDDAKKAGKEIGGSFSEARGTIALLGDDIGIRLPRHLQTFIAGLPGVAPIATAAFSAVAVVTLITKLGEAKEKSDEFKKKLQEQSRAAVDAALGIKEHADALEIANLRLQDQIAVLQKKPAHNGPAIAALEAERAMEKLVQSIGKAIEKQQELFKSQVQGELSKFFFGESEASEVSRQVVQMMQDATKAEDDYNSIKLLGDKSATDKALDNLRQRQTAVRNFVTDSIARFNELSHQADKVIPGHKIEGLGDAAEPDLVVSMQKQRDEATQLKKSLSNVYGIFLQSERDASAQLENDKLNTTKIGLEQGKTALDQKLSQFNQEWEGQKRLLDEQTKASIAFYKEQEALGKLSAGDATRLTQEALDAQFAAESAHNQALQSMLRSRPAELAKVLNEEKALAFAHDAEILSSYTHTLSEQNKALEEFVKHQAEAQKQYDKEENAIKHILKAADERNKAWLSGIDAITSGEQKQIAKLDQEMTEIKNLINLYHLQGDSAALMNRAITALSQQRRQLIDQEMTQSNKLGKVFKGTFDLMAIEGQQWGQKMSSVFQDTFRGMNNSLTQFIVTGKGGFAQLGIAALENILNIGLQWVESKALMLAFGKVAGSNEVLTQSAIAGASGVASMAGAPFPINLTAPAFGASMMANALSYLSILSAEGGALLPNMDSLVHTHPEEMILPRSISKFILDSMAQQRGGSQGSGGPTINFTHSPQFNGNEEQFGGMAEEFSKMSFTQLRRMARNVRRR